MTLTEKRLKTFAIWVFIAWLAWLIWKAYNLVDRTLSWPKRVMEAIATAVQIQANIIWDLFKILFSWNAWKAFFAALSRGESLSEAWLMAAGQTIAAGGFSAPLAGSSALGYDSYNLNEEFDF